MDTRQWEASVKTTEVKVAEGVGALDPLQTQMKDGNKVTIRPVISHHRQVITTLDGS